MNYRFAPGSRLEAIDLGDWFEGRRPGAGAAFATELANLIQRLLAQPRAYGRVSRAPRGCEVRVAMTNRFPSLVYYEVTAVELLILSVIHARGNRRIWRRRLP